ncbi:MAG: beta-propeller fold lactonase family protein, partial [Clostridiales bacterium]|nr:beta-propeller fold lactonase family protein [Clostridiales bacterium]
MKFYVGDYTRLGGPGVCLCELEDDALRFLCKGDVCVNEPTYVILSRDKKTLYATSGTSCDGESTGSIATYDVSHGDLRFTGMHSTGGTATCHLTLDKAERFLYAANYLSGSLSVFPVENGRVLPRIQLIEHEGHGPNEKRQERAHVH